MRGIYQGLVAAAVAAVAFGCAVETRDYAELAGAEEAELLPNGEQPECLDPAEGCPCEGNEPPEHCYAEPMIDQDGDVCTDGSRYCRDGVWGPCNNILSFRL